MNDKIISLANQFCGVNPHLNSILQTPSSEDAGLTMWPSFHIRHVVHIADYLNQVMASNYVAHIGRSLQIREEGLEDETIDPEEDFVKAGLIWRDNGNSQAPQLIARIEVLSPSNKPGRTGFRTYQQGRLEVLAKGVILIELDYIHESPPHVLRVPAYPADPGSYPYRIFVCTPQPSLEHGRVELYSFRIDDPLPVVSVPLSGDSIVQLDMDSVYNHTFKSGRWGYHVNYSQPPIRFHTYSEADQARIQQRMATIADARARGLDLEQGPFPLQH
jgi:hypothetical protein